MNLEECNICFIYETEADKPTKFSVIRYPLVDKLIHILEKYVMNESSAKGCGTLLELNNEDNTS
eukprot:snap_masked-scaffold_39-processed-gene-1.28-mRNA-1 protein AED:1.00 eAED:1.00 QI:0/0/0/0/1/1/2/0/63